MSRGWRRPPPRIRLSAVVCLYGADRTPQFTADGSTALQQALRSAKLIGEQRGRLNAWLHDPRFVHVATRSDRPTRPWCLGGQPPTPELVALGQRA